MRHGSGDHTARPPRIARLIRTLSIPIILFWLGIAIVLNIVTPSLDEVGKAHSVSMSPRMPLDDRDDAYGKGLRRVRL